MKKPRRIAMLIELPIGLENAQMASLRRFRKILVRSYGIRCLSVLPPAETITFGNQAIKTERAATVGSQAAAIRPDDENAADAKPAGPAKPRKRKLRSLLRGSPL